MCFKSGDLVVTNRDLIKGRVYAVPLSDRAASLPSFEQGTSALVLYPYRPVDDLYQVLIDDSVIAIWDGHIELVRAFEDAADE